MTNLSSIRALLPEFKTAFLDTPKGREHMAWFPSGRAKGRANFEEAVRQVESGKDVTDLVLGGLLPHLDSPYNRERGAWLCIAAVVTRDIRQWFEGTKWAKAEDWPHVSALILRFLRSVDSDPARLAEECERFRQSPHSTGFQAGFLSPILNAIRPSDFVLVNSKTVRTLRDLAGVRHTARLRDYPKANRDLHEIVADLGDAVPDAGVSGVLPADVFDAFCHWWVSIYKGVAEEEDKAVAELVSRDPRAKLEKFFPNAVQRREICALFAEAIERAHALAPGCWETSVRNKKIRLNVGRMVALELTEESFRIGLTPSELESGLRDTLQQEDRWSAEFATKPVTRLCAFDLERFNQLRPILLDSFREFLRLAAQTGLDSPFQRYHSPEMVDYLESVLSKTLPRPLYKTGASRRPAPVAGERSQIEPAVRMEGPQALFHKVDYTVGFLTQSIEMGAIGLPELQRPFVWERSKVRDLMDSMYRGFPVGYLLLWSNAQIQASRQIGVETKQIQVPEHLVVDGQQRLTSLYAVFFGAPVLNDNFQEGRIEIAFRPRDGRFEVTDAAVQRDPEFIPNISILWASKGGEHRFVSSFLQRLKETKELTHQDEDAISDNISRLINLVNYQLTAIVIQPDIEEEAVADIFVRINNQGVKLEQADFILTLLSVFWPEGRKQLEAFARAAKVPPALGSPPSPFNYLLQPGPDQMLRASVALGFQRGRLKAVYQILRGRDPGTGSFSADLRDGQFAKLKEAQPKVLNLNDWHAHIQSLRSAGFLGSDTISSENSVIFTYALCLIGKHQCGVREPDLGLLMRRWFVAVTLSARYSGSSETTMDADLADLREAQTPEEFVRVFERNIANTLTRDFWAISLPLALETSSSRAPELLAFWAAQATLLAPVLFSHKKVRDLLDPALRPPIKAVEQHHLFPKAWLRKTGITASKRINQVANLALLEWPKNRDFSDLPPSEYVPRMKQEVAAPLWNQMTHSHALPVGWESMEYEHFLEARRPLMAGVIREAFEALSTPPDGSLTLADATGDERAVWPLIERVEQQLRKVVRRKYDAEWHAQADTQISRTLGPEAMAAVEKNRAKHRAAYGGATPKETDLLDYCYLGQLAQLMVTGQAWKLFQEAFRDKRALEDHLKAIVPVRNDLAHFRRVPTRDLSRCKVEADDLLEQLARLSVAD